MRNAWAVAAAGMILGATALAGAPARAAQDDGDLWIVNAAGRPISVIVDGDSPTELARLANVRRPLTAGGHGVAVVADGQVVSVWQEFDSHNVSLNARGRPAWCYLAAPARDRPLQLTLLDPASCRALLTAGPAEDRAGLQSPPP